MRKLYLLVGVLAAGTASAADLPTRTPAYPAPAAWTWDGFYIGAHGGWASSGVDFPGSPAFPDGPPRQTLNGGLLGGQLGYNWQVPNSNVVLGAVADFSKTIGMGGSVQHDGNFLTETQGIDWTGTFRGRAGYAVGGFLPYATVGLQWDNSSASVACPSGAQFGTCSRSGAFNFSDSQWHTGLVWGGGIEYALNRNWSVYIEGLHADMGTQTYNLGGQQWHISHDTTSLLGGVNFRF